MNKEINKRLENYNKIKTPLELSSYMKDNIKYQWMDQNGLFHTEMDYNMYTNYSLMTPVEVVENSSGICVDQAELEREWFDIHNYQYEVLNIQIFREDSAPGHIFLIYFEDNKWNWFENAWGKYKGIHSYSSKENLFKDIKDKFIIQENITFDEISNIIIEDFPKYPYHISYEQMDNYDFNKSK